MAWYEGTRATEAEIITLELSPRMIAATRRTLDLYNMYDRVTLMEGPAQESYVDPGYLYLSHGSIVLISSKRIQKLTGTFDIIFVDANKDGYLGYVRAILDRKLLSPNGIIMCDNGK